MFKKCLTYIIFEHLQRCYFKIFLLKVEKVFEDLEWKIRTLWKGGKGKKKLLNNEIQYTTFVLKKSFHIKFFSI